MVLQNHDRSDLGSGPEKKHIKVSTEFSDISSQNHEEEAEETTSETKSRLRPPHPPFSPSVPRDQWASGSCNLEKKNGTRICPNNELSDPACT